MKNIINTHHAPAPIGPYNQAVEANGLIFISGQVAFIPGSETLVQDSTKAEATQVMKNLAAILHEAGLGFEHVIKTTIFLSDMKLFADVNAVYSEYFNANFPARETVAVLGLPRGANVEISMIAARH